DGSVGGPFSSQPCAGVYLRNTNWPLGERVHPSKFATDRPMAQTSPPFEPGLTATRATFAGRVIEFIAAGPDPSRSERELERMESEMAEWDGRADARMLAVAAITTSARAPLRILIPGLLYTFEFRPSTDAREC
ncbi:MAG TPA: hypothetical protein VNA87_01445, partial [Actinomycetota bacterium]|nr:hypothetical protein [Actinomycetota bacterium]